MLKGCYNQKMGLTLLQPTTAKMADQDLFVSPSVGLVHIKINMPRYAALV
jgi:hypothetical protein